MKRFFTIKKLKLQNTKIIKIYKKLSMFCLLLALIATMLLSFSINLDTFFSYNLGLLLLKLSIYFFTYNIICAISFERIQKDIT